MSPMFNQRIHIRAMHTANMNVNILLVDDDPTTIQLLARALAGVGDLRFATSGRGALRLARELLPDLMLLDAIEARDVRDRLGDDFGLFRSMIARLFDEFSNVPIPIESQGKAALEVHAARMHKLRGIAGLLGAKEIHRLAKDAEAACIAGEAEDAARLTRRLTGELQRLRECVASVLLVPEAARVSAATTLLSGEKFDCVAEIRLGVGAVRTSPIPCRSVTWTSFDPSIPPSRLLP